MGRYIVKRLLQMVLVLFGVTLLIFVLLSFTPGDPATIALGVEAEEEQLEAFRESHGLNDPVIVQYFTYMKNVLLHGDFGESYIYHTSVIELIGTRWQDSVILMLAAIALAILLSLPLGVAMALKQNSLFDNSMRVITLVFNSMPSFWLGMLLILLFSVKLGWLPPGGFDSFGAAILPVFCLSLTLFPPLARAGRSSMLEVIHQDYIRTAKAKGLSKGYIIRHHALKNTMLPLITLYGKLIGTSFGGSVLIETVFGINGIGKMMRDSLENKDTPSILGCVIISATVICVMNLVTDLLYGVVDPRLKSMYTKARKKKTAAELQMKKRRYVYSVKNTILQSRQRHIGQIAAVTEGKGENTRASVKSYKKRSLWGDVWIRFRKNKSAVAGTAIFILVMVICFSAPLFYDYEQDIVAIDAVNRLQGPSAEHVLGTDELGRDLLARIIYGGRTSMTCGILALVVAVVLGGVLGVVAAYYGGKIDTIIMRCIDVVMSIPSILLMITLATIMQPSVTTLILAIGFSLVPAETRLVRGQVLQVKDNEYIEAAKSQGASDFKVIVSHMLPNAMSPIITTIVLDMGFAITMISALSFIGMGIQAPAPEWGTILSSGRSVIREAWHITTFSGIALTLTVIALSLMGDGLRDALDPRMKR